MAIDTWHWLGVYSAIHNNFDNLSNGMDIGIVDHELVGKDTISIQ